MSAGTGRVVERVPHGQIVVDKQVRSSKRSSIKSHRINSSSSVRRQGLTLSGRVSIWQMVALFIILSLFIYSCYFYYIYLQEIRISRPSNEPRVTAEQLIDSTFGDDQQSTSSFHWGTYRPGVYFGLKTRSTRSPVFGLMWFTQQLVDNQLPIRHWCEMGDFDQRYTWLQHDGQNFGIQEIHDGDFLLQTSFVKRPGGRHGGDWTARFSVLPKEGRVARPISLLFYAALDGEGRLGAHITETGRLEAITGLSDATGVFQITFHDFNDTTNNILLRNHLITVVPGLDVLKEVVLSNLAYHTINNGNKSRFIGLVGERLPTSINPDKESMPNFIVQQVTIVPPFEMDVAYESASFIDRPNDLIDKVYTDTLKRLNSDFNSRFEDVFHLGVQKSSPDQIDFAKAAFSNMIGGIGYFNGHSLVQGQYNQEPIAYFETQLYTAVPSRSFFPRGFLWDEGFHQMLIGRFNSNITKDILAHWLDTMNSAGWIPREQILDRESRARVPTEFLVQRDTNANPPTLFLPLNEIVKRVDLDIDNDDDVAFLGRIFPRLKIWFTWFNRTQVGKLPGTYRWRGRNLDDLQEELNPITLTSGLDDYPRASHPTDDERHIDLRCWIAFASKVLASIARIVGEPEDAALYTATWTHLADNRLLDQLHWSPELETYADYGLHSNKVKLVKKRKTNKPGTQNSEIFNLRMFEEEPSLQFVDAHGYVSLFPFLLHILEPESPKLGLILDRLGSVDLLWTDYGLRSLAKTSPLYQKGNRPDSPPYWRGAIWINMNYLAVEALAHYGSLQGPFQQKSRELYYQLRANLVRNMYGQYKVTGYIWEQYDDQSGRGQRAHPFTGWSALITLIMSDNLNY